MHCKYEARILSAGDWLSLATLLQTGSMVEGLSALLFSMLVDFQLQIQLTRNPIQLTLFIYIGSNHKKKVKSHTSRSIKVFESIVNFDVRKLIQMHPLLSWS